MTAGDWIVVIGMGVAAVICWRFWLFLSRWEL